MSSSSDRSSPAFPATWRTFADDLLAAAELTANDVARQSGIERDELRRLWQALGFPPVTDDERHFTRTDVAVLTAVRMLIEEQHSDPSDVLQLTRVIGQAIARVADAQVTVIAERLARRNDAARSAPPAPAELVARVHALAPRLEQFLGYVWRRHLVAALLQLSVTPSAADRALTVGFADIVGFTAMTQSLDSRELATTVDRFEAVAYEQIVERGGRLVKMIGDEVMFSVEDGRRGAEIALALVATHARDPRVPEVRVGVATGPTLAWEGDLFGPTVNLASRLVNVARPGTVIVSEELGGQLRGDAAFDLRHLRAVSLKGIGRVRSWVLRRGA